MCVFHRGVVDVFQFPFTQMYSARFQQRPISFFCSCMCYQGYGSCKYQFHFILCFLLSFPIALPSMLGSYSCG